MPQSTGEPSAVPVGNYREFSYEDLNPNPQNPRRLFDPKPLQILEQSIRQNGILVPLTVYQEKRNKKFYILDGERRWRCAQRIESDPDDPRPVPVPANIVEPPSPLANILYMFNIHNLRETWDLMPTALSLKIVMDETGETDEHKLAEITQLSDPNVRRCKILLTFPESHKRMMLHPNTDERIKANFFVELHPVLDLYEKLPKKRRGKKTRDELTNHFLDMYRANVIKSVIHFRRVLEAHDHLAGTERENEFLSAAESLATDAEQTIRKLFDPLVAEVKSAVSAEEACRDFLAKLKEAEDHAYHQEPGQAATNLAEGGEVSKRRAERSRRIDPCRRMPSTPSAATTTKRSRP